MLNIGRKLITIDHHIKKEEMFHPEASGDFTSLMNDLTLAIRIITRDVRRAGLNDILGLTDTTNFSGERVRKLDSYANEVIKKAMFLGGNVCVMASEEETDIVFPKTKPVSGKYVLVFDPLDGSTNIDVNASIGTLFSVYKRLDENSEEPGTMKDVLQPGYAQAAAGYALYGSSTLLAYTTGHGLHIFTYDPTLGEFLLTRENFTIPKKGYYYSFNDANYYRWSNNLQAYADYLRRQAANGEPYISRYIATGVADIHRILNYGGIYLYPNDSKYPEGKFRLVYEANTLAMIVEQAGGTATTGYKRILDIIPESVHQRTPLIAGSPDNVSECCSFMHGENPYLDVFNKRNKI